MAEKFTSANFEAEVLQAGMPVLVDFYADWCGPCKMMAPAVEAAADSYNGRIKVGKLNVDENGVLCGDVDFQSLEGRAAAVTPVPGGVGTVTTAILARHLMRSAQKK